MAKNKNVIEEALLQISNLEESLNKNAQGILSSTMKEEISSLVKESLNEQDEIDDEEEDEVKDVVDTDETEFDNLVDVEDSEEEDDMLGMDDTEDDFEMEFDTDTEDDTIDLTGASDEEVLTVFKAMGDNDGVIVKKDDKMIHLSDTENDTEYLIQLGESEMDDFGLDSEMDDFGLDSEMDSDEELEELYSREVDDFDFYFSKDEEDEKDDDEEEDDDDYGLGIPSDMPSYKTKWSEDEDLEEEEIIFELELDDTELEESLEDEVDFDDEEERIYESKKGMKPKGVGMGNASKFKYDKKPNMGGGFKTVKKKANKTMGTGKAKFEYKEGVNSKGYGEKTKKVETKEASRTYGNGSKDKSRGLRKGITPNRNLTFENAQELEVLRAKNEEYRKALDLFRTKLNEVAVFNSNLAYATRLFTEHSTTKQEKINILRRFDNVDTLKESKSLYKVIKDELGSPKSTENTITESFERTVSKTPSTGSAVNLIESKTYENPQFLRMKDLMTKIK
jgi:hypothetical protein